MSTHSIRLAMATGGVFGLIVGAAGTAGMVAGYVGMSALVGGNVRAECPSALSLDYYFPNGTHGSAYDAEAAALALRALDLQPLSCGQPDIDESYRLTILDPWSVDLQAVQVDRSGDAATYRATRKNGDTPQSAEGAVETEAWHLATVFLEEEFWAAPAVNAPVESNVGCLDCWGALLEGRRGDHYRVLWHGTWTKPIDTLASLFQEMAEPAPISLPP